MECFVLLTVLVFASKNENDVESVAANSGENIMENAENSIVVKIEEDEYVKKRGSNYIGLSYDNRTSKWTVKRWSKTEKKQFANGTYKDEETAAHASDTLARILMKYGEQGHKLNFPDNNTEVQPKKTTSSKYFGVSYNERIKRWTAQRWSKTENIQIHFGYYKDEETAAHASDTLAKKLMTKYEQNQKLNFPDDNTEVYPEERITSSKYFGVCYNENSKRWASQRWSKMENKQIHCGSYGDEETAVHASDTLARQLIDKGEPGHKLNFPHDKTEVHKKTKSSQYIGVCYNQKLKRWVAQRWSKIEQKVCNNGFFKDEVMAARASENLARKLMKNGEQNHKLNFPDNSTKENSKQQTNKRKRSFDFDSEANEDNLEKFEEKEK